MPSFVVDPLLCTTPDESSSPEAVAAWLSAVDAWLSALEASPFVWKHVYRCTEQLLAVGRFPHFDALRWARERSGRDIASASLLQRINRFFQDDTRDLYTALPTQVALPDSPPVIDPEEFVERNLAEVRDPLIEALLCLALDKTRGDDFAAEASIITLPFMSPHNAISIVSGEVEVEPPNTRETAVGNDFPVMLSPGDLAAFRFAALIEGGGPHFTSLVADVAQETFPGRDLIPFAIGSHFWRSLHQSAIIEDGFAAEKLLRTCAAIVTGRTDDLDLDRRPIRKTESPDSAQRERPSDKAKAWRITITKHGAGYRLHYWAVPTPGGGVDRIELANVLRERERVAIPDD